MPGTARRSPGDAVPDCLPDAAGRPVSLSGLAGRKGVLYSYPAAGTPGCRTQAGDFRDELTRFEGAGYAYVKQGSGATWGSRPRLAPSRGWRNWQTLRL